MHSHSGFSNLHPFSSAIAVVTFLSKALIIPYFIATIQEKIRIKRDIEFHFLSPTTSLILSMALMLVVYMALTRILRETPAWENPSSSSVQSSACR